MKTALMVLLLAGCGGAGVQAVDGGVDGKLTVAPPDFGGLQIDMTPVIAVDMDQAPVADMTTAPQPDMTPVDTCIANYVATDCMGDNTKCCSGRCNGNECLPGGTCEAHDNVCTDASQCCRGGCNYLPQLPNVKVCCNPQGGSCVTDLDCCTSKSWGGLGCVKGVCS